MAKNSKTAGFDTNIFDPANNPFLNPKANPFLDPEKNPLLNSDLAKAFQAPTANMGALNDLMAAQQENFQALAAANKTAVEGFQAVFVRQSAVLKEMMEEAAAAAQEMSAAGAPEDQIAGRIEQVKDLMQQSVANIREMSEMIAKSQSEAFDILNNRAAKNLDQLKTAVRSIKA